MVELEDKIGDITEEEYGKLLDGLSAEVDSLKDKIKKLQDFGKEMNVAHTKIIKDTNWQEICDVEELRNPEAASQHIGYLESKVFESMETIDKILLEMAAHLGDNSNDNKATDQGEDITQEC